jgi:ComF family protein
MLSWAQYEGSVRNSIHSLKYRNNIALGYFFAMKLLPMIIETSWPIDLVLPVPLSKSHYKNRGYNQAALISRPLARSLNVQHDTKALQRIRETSTQTKLSADQRFLNVEGAFSANPAKLKDKKVLLVDDVITTGATMINCTKALLTSGASKVFCISVARVFVDESRVR